MSVDFNPYEFVTVPDGWTCKCLIECTEGENIPYGVVQPGQHVNVGVPIIRINNINNGQLDLSDVLKISPEIEVKYKRTRLKGGEVLLTLVGSTGQSFVAPKELAGWNVPRAIAVIRAKKEIGAEWVNLCLQTQETKHFLNVRANTTVQKTLNLKDVRDIPILIPPNQIKESITNIALSLSNKIQLNRQINQTLEKVAQAIFKSWLVDFDPTRAKVAAKEQWENQNPQVAKNDPAKIAFVERAAMCVISGKSEAELDQLDDDTIAQLKATAALFPDSLKDSELGEIPEGWGTHTIEDVMELAYGKALNKNDRTDGNFPVYGSGGLTGKHNVCLVDGPGVIIGRKGTVGSLYWEDKPFYPIDTVFYVKCKNDVTLVYAYYLLQTLGLEGMNTDAAVPGLNRNNVYRLEIPEAPIELIKHFSIIGNSIRNKIQAYLEETTSLTTLRESLLPKLLSGELNVGEVA